MFIHSFKYTLKILLKNKTLIFWTFIFPILLGTLFKLAFSNIEKSENLKLIDIAIVDNEEYKNNKIFNSIFNTLGDNNNKNQIFNIKYTNLEESKKLLDDKKIDGYMIIEDDIPKIVIHNNGINQTIFKYVVDEVYQNSIIVNDAIKEETDYSKIYIHINEIMNNKGVTLNNISNKNLSYTMIEFYTLIAMTCLYGGILVMTSINQNLANMSSQGKRISISPTSKFKIILGSLLSSYLVQMIGLLLVILYTIFALNVNYGNNLLYVIILSLVGSLAGLSLGLFVSCAFKVREESKLGIMISITMAGCFLAGMMGITLKYIIDTNIPLLNKINPVAMITDGLYSLYYYTTLNRYIFNVVSLLLFSLVFIIVSILFLRRQKYDSI